MRLNNYKNYLTVNLLVNYYSNMCDNSIEKNKTIPESKNDYDEIFLPDGEIDYARFFDLFHDNILKTIHYINSTYKLSYDDISDIYQFTCERFLTYALAKFNKRSQLKTFVFRVTSNAFSSWVKKNIKNMPVSLDRVLSEESDLKGHDIFIELRNDPRETERDTDISETREATYNEIRDCIAEMSARKKTIYKMYFDDGFKQEQISEILKISQSTVSGHVTDIKNHFEQYFKGKKIF
ncbi:RNA polymerase sigma factor [Spirochaetota bacterium]